LGVTQTSAEGAENGDAKRLALKTIRASNSWRRYVNFLSGRRFFAIFETPKWQSVQKQAFTPKNSDRGRYLG
jgi:hypothetical protein